MRILLGQLEPTPGQPTSNARRIVEALEANSDADMAVFPELAIHGYDLGAVAALAEPIDNPSLRLIQAAARNQQTAVIVGFAEQRTDGTIANSAACIDRDGGMTAVYRKVNLFGAENKVFAAGGELLLISLAGWRVGVLVCFDVEFPEPARALARAGADLFVTISANMEPFYGDHELLSRARALENRRPHAYVNRVGSEGRLRFVGGSRFVDGDGNIVAQLDDKEEFCAVDVPSIRVDPRLDYVSLSTHRPRHVRVSLHESRQQPLGHSPVVSRSRANLGSRSAPDGFEMT